MRNGKANKVVKSVLEKIHNAQLEPLVIQHRWLLILFIYLENKGCLTDFLKESSRQGHLNMQRLNEMKSSHDIFYASGSCGLLHFAETSQGFKYWSTMLSTSKFCGTSLKTEKMLSIYNNQVKKELKTICKKNAKRKTANSMR